VESLSHLTVVKRYKLRKSEGGFFIGASFFIETINRNKVRIGVTVNLIP